MGGVTMESHYSSFHYCFSSSSSSYDECYSTHVSEISPNDNESMLHSSGEIEQSHHQHPHVILDPHDEHESDEDDSDTNISFSNSSTTTQSLLNVEDDPLQLIDFTVGKIGMLCVYFVVPLP